MTVRAAVAGAGFAGLTASRGPDRGILVVRTPERNLVLPPMRSMHWARRAFEKMYLRK